MSQTCRPSELWIALLARLCTSWLDSRRSWTNSAFRNCSEVSLISLVIWPYCPIDSSWMLRIALVQSRATRIFGVGGHLQVPNPLYMPLLPEFLGPKSVRRSPLTLRGRDLYYHVPPLLLQPNSNSWKWRRQHLSLSDPREGESTWDVGPASPALFSEVASQDQARQ